MRGGDTRRRCADGAYLVMSVVVRRYSGTGSIHIVLAVFMTVQLCKSKSRLTWQGFQLGGMACRTLGGDSRRRHHTSFAERRLGFKTWISHRIIAQTRVESGRSWNQLGCFSLA